MIRHGGTQMILIINHAQRTFTADHPSTTRLTHVAKLSAHNGQVSCSASGKNAASMALEDMSVCAFQFTAVL